MSTSQPPGTNSATAPPATHHPPKEIESHPLFDNEEPETKNEISRDLSDVKNGSPGDGSATGQPVAVALALARTGSSLRRVPTLQRRGYGQLTLIPEVENPRNYSRGTKWLLTVIVALAAVAGPMGSSILYPALADMATHLNTSQTTGNITVAIFMLGMAIFPIWWSSLSEVLGRRLMYLCSFTLFVLFGALSAASTSIGMMIAVRFLAGGASASVQTVGTGTISDIWAPEERGKAMGVFYMGPLLGPMIAPLLGGAIAEVKGWRWTLWLLTFYGAAVLGSIFMLLPETSKRQVAEVQETRESKTEVAKKTIKRYLLDPIKVLYLFPQRLIFVAVIYAALTFGAVYVLNMSLTMIFENAPYNFSQVQVGLMYMPMSSGYLITSFLSGGWSDNIMKKAQRDKNRVDVNGVPIYYPEDRFGINMWIAAWLYPASMVTYGWVVYYEKPWWASVIPLFTFGVGTMIIFGVATAALTELVPKRSSAGVAVNNFIRNIFSFTGALVAKPIIDAGGTGKVFSILAGICVGVGIFSLILINMFGSLWRDLLDQSESYPRREPASQKVETSDAIAVQEMPVPEK